MSQPAISLQIQNLERQLNVPIFYRDKRKASLTETGQLLKNIVTVFLVYVKKLV